MILRFCVCIPTYNNPATIEKVVRDCLDQTPYRVLVIDDGSVPAVQLNLVSDRVEIIRLEKNQGKGVALQVAMKESLKRGFTHMIAIDGDGQHLAHQISKLTDESLAHPWDMVIGNRKFASENVPGVSKFGRNFSNFWVKFQTSAHISDSQSGFRIYPLFWVQNMRFWTRRFDFEIEVLIRLLWKNVHVREVEIECYYPPRGERVSHFHKFKDNVRISCLNTILVILSLLRAKHSPLQTALAVSVGVFVGCTPFFGFHTLIIAGLAFLFRLNAPLMWLGTQVSIPPVAPFLAIASIKIGEAITGQNTGVSFHSISDILSQGLKSLSGSWLLGSTVLGAALGGLAFLVTYIVAKNLYQRAPAKKASWNGRTRGGKFGNGFLKLSTKYLGLRATYGFLFFIVPYFYLFAPKARRAANEYWRVTHPELSWTVRQWKVLGQLFKFAQTLLDRVYQGFYPKPVFKIHSNGMENILHVMRRGEGLIMMSAHVGGWDLAAANLKTDGLGTRFHMVKYESQGMTFDKARGQGDPAHVQRLAANQASQPVLQIREFLGAGQPVGLMGDRPVGNQFELVSFFGKLAPMDVTPFKIAATCGAPLLFTLGFKGKGMSYDFYAVPSQRYQYVTGLDKNVQVLDWAHEYARFLEDKMRAYPDQWFNFFPFWSTVPTPPEGVEVSKARNHSREQLQILAMRKPASASGPTPSAEPGSPA